MQKVIGLVHTRFAPNGGVENYINKLVPSLLERNWQIHYFTGRVRQPVPAGMIVYKIPVIRGTSVSRMLSFAYGARRAIQRSKLPLVMGFGRTIYQDIYRDGSGCFLDYEKHTTKKFSVLYRRSYLHLEQKRFRDPRLLKVITVSQMVKEQIINRYHLPGERIEVVYSGVETLQLKPELKRQKAEFRKKLQITKDALTLLFIGNGFKRKGLQYLIKAAAHLPSDLPFVVLVAGKDKNARRYQRMACEFKCQEHVRFLGHQRETGVLYGAADLFVLPSVFDPIANVVLESLYTGTPVITGPQVGASELIRNGINGFVVGDYGPETLTEAIMKFYRSDEKEKMAAEAHRAAAAYRWDRHISRLEALFLRTLAQKNSAHKSTCL